MTYLHTGSSSFGTVQSLFLREIWHDLYKNHQLNAKSCISEYWIKRQYWTKWNILGWFGWQMSDQPMIFPFVQYSLIFNIHLYMIWHKMQYYLIRFFFKKKIFCSPIQGQWVWYPQKSKYHYQGLCCKAF